MMATNADTLAALRRMGVPGARESLPSIDSAHPQMGSVTPNGTVTLCVHTTEHPMACYAEVEVPTDFASQLLAGSPEAEQRLERIMLAEWN